MGRFYTEYSDFLTRLFPGVKVQKISIDAGHNCPNRDGTLIATLPGRYTPK